MCAHVTLDAPQISRYVFHFNFYKNACPIFFLFPCSIAAHSATFSRFSLPSGSDTIPQIGQPRANFISALNFYSILRAQTRPIDAPGVCSFSSSCPFLSLFFFALERVTCISDATDLIKKSRRGDNIIGNR